MNSVIEWLKGKKTYIVCAAAILTAIGAYLNETLTLTQLIESILAALGGMTIRAAISKK